MYPRSTPTNVVPRHGSNQFAHIGINSWSTTPTPARFPGPAQSKSSAMPSDQSVWLEDCQGLDASWPEPIEPDPEYALAGVKAVPFIIAIGHHCQLLAQGKHLEMKRGAAPQEVDQGCEQRNKYRFHAGNATHRQPELSMKSTRTGFLVGTGSSPASGTSKYPPAEPRVSLLY